MKLHIEYDDFVEYVEAVSDGELVVVEAEDDVLRTVYLVAM